MSRDTEGRRAKRPRHERPPVGKADTPPEPGVGERRFLSRWRDFCAKLLQGHGPRRDDGAAVKTLSREDYRGLIVEMEGQKGRACNHLAECSDLLSVLPVLNHVKDIDLGTGGDTLHRRFATWLLAWLTKGLLAGPTLVDKDLLERYSRHAFMLLMRLDRWAGRNKGRRRALLSIVSTEDLWRLVAITMDADVFDNTGYTLTEIVRITALFENPPSPGVLSGLASACDRVYPAYIYIVMVELYRKNRSYVESLPAGVLGHRLRISLDLTEYYDLATAHRPRAVAEMIRLTGGFDAVVVYGTIRFVAEAVLPALRASTSRDYYLDTYINENFNDECSAPFARLTEAVWDLPVSQWTLSLHGYAGHETFGDMVGLLSAFDLRSLHQERVALIKPNGDPGHRNRCSSCAYHKACWRSCVYNKVIDFLKGGGWQEVVLSPR
jgi:hypothetical protein